MKSRPILFSAPMVRALLDGSKTQTRRIVKNQPPDHADLCLCQSKHCGGNRKWHLPCPYGQPGDQLWVRETWRTTGDGGRCDHIPPSKLQPHPVWYDADGKAPADQCCGKTRVSIFMLKWASRITLEITGVRVERLQDISESDAMAEGIILPEFARQAAIRHCELQGIQNPRPAAATYRELWNSINAEKGPGEHGHSWTGNPLVWVLEFRKLS